MKSIKVLLLSAAIALTAAACSSSSSPETAPVDTGSQVQSDVPAAGTGALDTMQQ